MSRTLEYAGLGSDRRLTVVDDGRTLTITQHQTLLDYAADQVGSTHWLSLATIPFYMAWVSLTKPTRLLPAVSQVTLGPDGLTDCIAVGLSGKDFAPLQSITALHIDRIEYGVCIDAPGYLKATFFKGRKDDQAIADTLNRRLLQLREAAG